MPAKVKSLVRVCKDCKVEFPFTEEFFYKWNKPRKDGSFGLRTHCKKCWGKNVNPLSAKNAYAKRTFNLNSWEDYTDYVDARGQNCECCGDFISKSIKKGKNKLTLDHCHTTGMLRGVLCTRCNTGIGLFDDDVEKLKKAITYLDNWGKKSGQKRSK